MKFPSLTCRAAGLAAVIALMAADPEMRAVAYIVGGATIMLFVLFLLAVAHRRRIRRRFFESTTDHTVRVLVDDAGIAVKSAAGNSALPWSAIGRVWAGREVVLVFYHGLALSRVPHLGGPGECDRIHRREEEGRSGSDSWRQK